MAGKYCSVVDRGLRDWKHRGRSRVRLFGEVDSLEKCSVNSGDVRVVVRR